MKTVPLTQARYNLRDLTHRAQAGDVFVLTDRGREVAALAPVTLVNGHKKIYYDAVGVAAKIRKDVSKRSRKMKIEKTSLEILRELRDEASR